MTEVGDRVKVTTAPWAGTLGVIESIDGAYHIVRLDTSKHPDDVRELYPNEFEVIMEARMTDEQGPTPATVFDRVLNITLQNEGGYVSAEQARAIGDDGKATNMGITQVTLDRLGVPLRASGVTPAIARGIYFDHYWALPYGARSLVTLAPAAALAVFDAGVQHDPRLAIRMFQAAAQTEPDGFAGPLTMRDANVRGVAKVLVGFHMRRRRLVVRWALRRLDKRKALLEGLVARVDRMEHTSLQWLAEDMGLVPFGEVFGA